MCLECVCTTALSHFFPHFSCSFYLSPTELVAQVWSGAEGGRSALAATQAQIDNAFQSFSHPPSEGGRHKFPQCHCTRKHFFFPRFPSACMEASPKQPNYTCRFCFSFSSFFPPFARMFHQHCKICCLELPVVAVTAQVHLNIIVHVLLI